MKVKVNNIELYYEKIGEGRPLIMVHGNGEDHNIFTKSAEILSSKFEVYLIDSRGHGKSKYSGKLHSRSEQIKMMLEEPNIDPKLLREIKVKTYITAGSRDMIYLKHMEYISKQIPNCNFKIFQGETHGSYVVKSIIIGKYILSIIR